jgi:hypothetical protein
VLPSNQAAGTQVINSLLSKAEAGGFISLFSSLLRDVTWHSFCGLIEKMSHKGVGTGSEIQLDRKQTQRWALRRKRRGFCPVSFWVLTWLWEPGCRLDIP